MKLAVIALVLLPACAQAQVYKCVAADGSTSYATVPCPESSGETTRIIEPVPPSGVLNIPVTEQPAEEQPDTTDSSQTHSPVSGLTVIPDSEDPAREQKRTQMHEEAARHKQELYDNTLQHREQQNPNRRINP